MRRYSQEIKDKVRSLRIEQGLSLGQIQLITKIPKTTIHLWIKNYSLTVGQKAKIKGEALLLLQKGRIRVQEIQKERKRTKEQELTNKGKKEIDGLTNRELFIAGVALYWAEGFKNKHEHRLGFCNSDPSMIKFYLYWLKESLGVRKELIVARLTLNESYKEKTEKIETYWSSITEIPLSQFTKTFYQHTKWKKQYADKNYYGVLRIHVKDSLDILLRMRGWIDGLRLNLPG